MGVAPVITSFARHVKQRHGKLPKEFWRIGAFFCTSVPKIHWKYAPILRYFYGEAPVVEMYTATEGVFAQQLDDLPYVSPNYDTYFFEVPCLTDMSYNSMERVVACKVLNTK